MNPLNPHAIGVSNGDTITLSGEAAVKPENLKNLRPKRPSTLTPQACQKGREAAPYDILAV